MGRTAGPWLTVSPGFWLLAAWLYYLGGGAALTAWATAALAHELGHLCAMVLAGAQLRRLRLTPAGPVIDYAGAVSDRQQAWILGAGPLAGAVFALGCIAAGTLYFRYAGTVALLATMFNLLPVLPMDGGRLCLMLLERELPPDRAERLLRWVGSLTALGMLATGAILRAIPAGAAGLWMLLLANRPDLR